LQEGGQKRAGTVRAGAAPAVNGPMSARGIIPGRQPPLSGLMRGPGFRSTKVAPRIAPSFLQGRSFVF
jgi:hypothetical protein